MEGGVVTRGMTAAERAEEFFEELREVLADVRDAAIAIAQKARARLTGRTGRRSWRR